MKKENMTKVQLVALVLMLGTTGCNSNSGSKVKYVENPNQKKEAEATVDTMLVLRAWSSRGGSIPHLVSMQIWLTVKEIFMNLPVEKMMGILHYYYKQYCVI